MRKSTILKDMQDALNASLSQVKYIDKNWGQLDMANPSVGFPCILLDIDNVEYSDLTGGWQMADATVIVTVANNRTNASSSRAPQVAKNLSYYTLELTDEIHEKLQGFQASHNGSVYSPLVRTSFNKVTNGLEYECYEMRYRTSWKVAPIQAEKNRPQRIVPGVEFDPHPGQQ